MNMDISNIVRALLIICAVWYGDAKVFQGLFFPEDIQTILNVAYSRLPPVKLGNDKRFGVGFRLGKNADFQMLLELGPQSETAALGDPNNSLNKRENHPKKYNHWEKPKTATSKTVSYTTLIEKSNPYKTENPIFVGKESYSLEQKGNYKYTTSIQNTLSRIPNDKTYNKMISTTNNPVEFTQRKEEHSYDTLRTTKLNIVSKIPNEKIHNKMISSTMKPVDISQQNLNTFYDMFTTTIKPSFVSEMYNVKTNNIMISTTNKPVQLPQKKTDTFYDMFETTTKQSFISKIYNVKSNNVMISTTNKPIELPERKPDNAYEMFKTTSKQNIVSKIANDKTQNNVIRTTNQPAEFSQKRLDTLYDTSKTTIKQKVVTKIPNDRINNRVASSTNKPVELPVEQKKTNTLYDMFMRFVSWFSYV